MNSGAYIKVIFGKRRVGWHVAPLSSRGRGHFLGCLLADVKIGFVTVSNFLYSRHSFAHYYYNLTTLNRYGH